MAVKRPYGSMISHAREYDRLNPTKKGMERQFARGLMQLRGFEADAAPPKEFVVKKAALKGALKRKTPGLKGLP